MLDVAKQVFGELESVEGAAQVPSLFEFLPVAGNPDLEVAAGFFNSLCRTLEVGNKSALRNPELQGDFLERFREFSSYLEEEILELESRLHGTEKYNRFSQNWKSNIRKACYYSFFAHYGAKRRGERDNQGKIRDYVRHPVRTAFNVLLRKMRFFDERTVIAAILHDTKEDFAKGIVRVAYADENVTVDDFYDRDGKGTEIGKAAEKCAEKKKEIVLGSFADFESDLDASVGERGRDEISVSELIDLLTKTSDNRMHALLTLFVNVAKMPKKKRFSSFKAIIVKMADRLDNIKSFKAGQKVDVAEEIEDETAFIFMMLCHLLDMNSAWENFVDYVWFKDNPDKRAGFVATRHRSLDSPENLLRQEFKRDFEERLCRVLGKDVEEGRDYLLQFKDRGHRYENKDRAEREISDGMYSRAFRGYIIFYPVGSDPLMAAAAKKIMGEIFSDEFDAWEEDRKELDSAKLAKLVKRYGGSGYDVDKYGAGVWSVFDSDREAISVFQGAFHAGYFFGDKKCGRRIVRFLDEVGPMAEFLCNQYKLLERVEMGGSFDALEDTHLRINRSVLATLGLMRRVSPEDLVMSSLVGDPRKNEIVLKIRRLLRDIAGTILLRPMRLVGVAVNDEIRDVYLPGDVADQDMAAGLFSAPLLAGRGLKFTGTSVSIKQLRRSYSVNLRRVLSRRRSSFVVDTKVRRYMLSDKEFDPHLFERQRNFLRDFLQDYKRQIFKEEVLKSRGVKRRMKKNGK